MPTPEQEIEHLAEQCATLLRENERLRADRIIVLDWMREPDFVENANFAFLIDWMNKRPIAAVHPLQPVGKEWCSECGCGSDVHGFAHLETCSEHLKKRITSLETALRFRDDFIKNRGMWDEFVKRATEFARSLRMEAYESARRACDKPKPYSRNCVASEVPGATCLQPDCDCLSGHEEHERDGV
jgi:hypothetical protein